MIGESDAVRKALEQLRETGERVTPARRAVLEVLDLSRGHLDAEAIATQVDARESGVHRATVYRTLQSLASIGVIAHTHVPGGPTIYHLAPSVSGQSTHPEHAHLQCTVCLRFFDIPVGWLEGLQQQVREELDFDLVPDHAALLGICSECRAGGNEHGDHPHGH